MSISRSWRMRWEKAGGHVHCTLFAASSETTTYANCGNLVVREEEFEDLQRVMPHVIFVEKK